MDRWVISSIDNLRVVAEAKGKGWRSGDVAPPLPGVDWACWKDDGNVGEEWWATALAQRQPLVMRTSEQFYGALERCVVGQSQFFLGGIFLPGGGGWSWLRCRRVGGKQGHGCPLACDVE